MPPATYVEALRDLAETTRKGFVFVGTDAKERPVAWADVWRDVRRRAAALVDVGVRPGDRVVLALPEPEDFVLSFFAVAAAGAVPVPVYPPKAMGRTDAWSENLRAVAGRAGAKLLLTSPAVQPSVGEPGTLSLLLTTQIADATHVPDDAPCLPSPDDLGLLQFTSGSTSQPKGVRVKHANLAANARAIMIDGLRSDPERDVGVSWLPLYHDMGLIGFVVAPLWTGVPVVLMPTTGFVRRPSSWLDAIHRHRGTITFAPNFAFALATQAIQARHAAGWDLSCLRALGCGAEPIDAGTLRAFLDKFAPCGMRATSILPSYGMAEATLAVTFAELDAPLRTDRVSARALNEGRAVPDDMGVEIVGCGREFPEHRVEILGDDGQVLPERRVGEITILGPSVADGYFADAEATAGAFRDGRLFSGDLGYLADGELFVCGRVKDVIIVHGRNYYPQDIERIACEVDGVRMGQVAVFACAAERTEADLPGDARLVVVAESRLATGSDAANALKQAVSTAVWEQAGLRVDDVRLIRRGTLPRTSSGKVRRRDTRARYLAGTLDEAHAADPEGEDPGR